MSRQLSWTHFRTVIYLDDELDGAYINFCNEARKIAEFLPSELYQDKTAILRTTNLGKDRYDKILNCLK